ncbi:MAG: WxL protein peptidoglycan domain-containing protein [Micrococcaceae bacterium]
MNLLSSETPRPVSALLPLSALLVVLTVMVLLLSPLLAGPATADTAEESGSAERTVWSLTPALEADQADTASEEPRVSFRASVDPGGSVEDAVTLTNFSATEATFTLQAADGVVSESGAFDILRPGEENTGAGQWIELEQTEVTVPADGEVTVPFTLTVPENATPGDHPAGIAASVSSGSEDDVAMVSRVGTRIHLRVTGDLAPTLAIGGPEVDYQQNWNPFAPGTATITWQVANEGNVRLGAQQSLESTGPLGLAGATAEVEPIREVLPGGQAQVSVEQRVWPLFGLTSRVTATPAVVGEDEIDAELSTAEAQSTTAAIPLPQLILLVLLALVIWWLATRKKRAQKKFDAAVAAAAARQHHSDAQAETDAEESATAPSRSTSSESV